MDAELLHFRKEPQLCLKISDLSLQLAGLLGGCKGQGPAIHGFRRVDPIMCGDDVQVGLVCGPIGVALFQSAFNMIPFFRSKEKNCLLELTAPTGSILIHEKAVIQGKAEDGEKNKKRDSDGFFHVECSFLIHSIFPRSSSVRRKTSLGEVSF